MAETLRSAEPAPLALDEPFEVIADVVRFEPPDLVLVKPVRLMTPDEEKRFVMFLEEASAQVGGVFSLSDLSAGVPRMSMSSALEMNSQLKGHVLRATAIVGASFQMRVFSEGIMRAARLLRFPVASVPVRFFPDEVVARAWFDEIRRASRPPA